MLVKKDQAKQDELLKLFPGQVVNLDGVLVKVYPMGVRHLKQFSEAVSRILPDLVQVFDTMDKKEKEKLDELQEGKPNDPASSAEQLPVEKEDVEEAKWIAQAISGLLPLCMGDFIDIINECCDVDITLLPQHLLPPIISAWIKDTFGSPGKVKAWVDLMKNVMAMTSQAISEPSKQTSKNSQSSN